MATNPQLPAFGGGSPLPPGYISDVSRLDSIYRTIGGLEKLFDGLGAATKANTENIGQLTRRVCTIPSLKKDIAQNEKRLILFEKQHGKELKDLKNEVNGLGKRLEKDIGDLKKVADRANLLVKIAYAVVLLLAGPLFLFLHDHVTLHFR